METAYPGVWTTQGVRSVARRLSRHAESDDDDGAEDIESESDTVVAEGRWKGGAAGEGPFLSSPWGCFGHRMNRFSGDRGSSCACSCFRSTSS